MADSPTLTQLKLQAHQLVEQVSHRPGAAKLLMGVVEMLKTFASYKIGRERRFQK